MNHTTHPLWHTVPVADTEKLLGTDRKLGLSSPEAARRIAEYGENELERQKRPGIMKRIIMQVRNPLALILFAAGAGAFFLGEIFNTIIIFIAAAINVAVGLIQEGRADTAFEKLMASEEQFATVMRGGAPVVVPASLIVPGDICLLEAGAHIPADMRLAETYEFSVNEAALTGEWLPVGKDVAPISNPSVSVTDRTNMAWKGTLAASGKASGIVVATGARTEFGKIARALSYQNGGETPLQKKIRALARFLAFAACAVIVLILVLGVFRGEQFTAMLLTGIALAVASVPEGLPAAVTVVLAIGMEAILKKGGLVRNLLAAETLGGTTVILTDKTGTLTRAEMRVARILSFDGLDGNHHMDELAGVSAGAQSAIERDILELAILASDAFVVGGTENALSEWEVKGRPVERAIVLAGLESGLRPNEVARVSPREGFLPFSSEKKFTASLVQGPKGIGYRLIVSGSPEFILSRSQSIRTLGGIPVQMESIVRRHISDAQAAYGVQGFRVIAVGYRDILDGVSKSGESGNIAAQVSDLVWGGLIVLHDPLRLDVRESVSTARAAGARVIMVTGDNPATAETIAREAGIFTQGDRVISGAEMDVMTDAELVRALSSVSIVARVLPEQKVRIARILAAQGEVVAMTGDGVNDAPALRAASIGIALGSGTEVAKEASDLILVNDSFSIIVRAIEEGRRIIDNLKKIVAYLLSTALSEISLIGGALLAGAPLPILPAQILWVNILEEGFMNFAFAFEPAEPDVMKRKPNHESSRTILSRDLKTLLGIVSATTGAFLIAVYFFLLSLDIEMEKIRTLMFACLSVASMFFAFSIKNLRAPIWNIRLFSNRYLLASLASSIALFAAALSIPPLRELLSLTPLSIADVLFVVVAGCFNLTVIEIAKFFAFRRVPNVTAAPIA